MMRSAHSATLLLWIVCAAVALRGMALNADFLHDDAFITLRYAQNWLAGNGVVWNPGDRVEGYTNFLQLLGVTGLGRVGVDLVLAARAVGFGAFAATLAFLAWWGGWGGRDDSDADALGDAPSSASALLLASLPVALVASALPLLAWIYGGLEAPLLALWLTIGVAFVQRALRDPSEPWAAPIAGVALALACLTRLDAGLFVLLAAGFLIAETQGQRATERLRRLAGFAWPLVLLLVPWLLWKLVYYGDLLPNTFYVKATDADAARFAAGVRYLSGLLLAPPFTAGFCAAGLARSVWKRRLRAPQVFAASGLCAYALWILYVGGDQMPMYRLLVPLIPTSVLLAVDLWRPDLRGRRDAVSVAVAVTLTLLVPLQLADAQLGLRNRNSTAFVGAAVGRHIASAWPAGTLVALNTAGSTPYYAPRLRYIDMLGLNDAHIARRDTGTLRVAGQRLPGHAKGDGAYVLAKQPDFIVLGPAHGVRASEPWFLSDWEIVRDPGFQRDYRLRRARIDARAMSGWQDVPETRRGELIFTWYERVQSR